MTGGGEIRIVMVGAGGVAQRHVGVLSGLADVRVVAVADPQPGAAATLAATCGATAFLDVEEALDAAEADAVYVCVPPFAHGAPERAVLERRLPLFVEKPVAAGLEVAEELGALVAAAGVVTGTGYHWRCLDTVTRAQDLLASSPAMLACGYWLDKRPPVPWWAHQDRSGGQVVEQLTHVVDLARVLLGEVAEVFAVGTRIGSTDDAADRGDVDDATAATVRFLSGAVATLAATSLLNAKHRAGLHLFGPGLALELSETALLVDDGRSRMEYRPAVDPRVSVDQEFIEAVRGGAPTRAPYAEGLRTHRVACAVVESARTGRPVRLAGDQR
jgi:predicted dehydrogenase